VTLSRKSLQKSEGRLKKNPDDFVNAAEPAVTESARKVGRPATKKEKAAPVSLSLTPTDLKTLDGLAPRLNFLAYQSDLKADVNRSDIVRMMAKQLSELDDAALLDWYNAHRS
jgi:hypothetical protein